MSKLNIMIECTEKNNAVENSVNTVRSGTFHNVLHNLQWGANKFFFFDYHFFISIEYWIWSDQCYEQQGGTDHCSSLKSNLIFLLLFHWTRTYMDCLSWFCCCMCMLYDAKRNTTYAFQIMKKERKRKGMIRIDFTIK